MPREADLIAIRRGCGFEDLLCELVRVDLEKLDAPANWREPLSVHALTLAVFWGLPEMPPKESDNPTWKAMPWVDYVESERAVINAISRLSMENPGRFFELMGRLSKRMEKRRRSPEFNVFLLAAMHPDLANLPRREIVEALKAEPGSTVTLKVVENALGELRKSALVDPAKTLPVAWLEHPIRGPDSL